MSDTDCIDVDPRKLDAIDKDVDQLQTYLREREHVKAYELTLTMSEILEEIQNDR